MCHFLAKRPPPNLSYHGLEHYGIAWVRDGLSARSYSGTTAVASISISARSSIRALTTTAAIAG
jgi:hypothetical protein